MLYYVFSFGRWLAVRFDSHTHIWTDLRRFLKLELHYFVGEEMVTMYYTYCAYCYFMSQTFLEEIINLGRKTVHEMKSFPKAMHL